MEPFTSLTAVAAPLELPDVDTDRIIPGRFLTRPRSEGLGRYAFHDMRFDQSGAERPEFPLNQAPYRAARILVADANFGCGSSRESAVWALAGLGIRAVIAPSFGDIFYTNCTKNGLLPVRLPAGTVAAMRAAEARVTRGLGERRVDSLEAARTLSVDPGDVVRHPIVIHDDTLRDGEQTVAVAFSIEQKVDIARRMIDAGMTSFSPGFPAVSEQEREAALAVRALGGPAAELYPLCRTLRRDVEVAMSCGYGGVAMFVPISDSHLRYKLGIEVEQAYAMMMDGIRLARAAGLRVRFGFEDVSRTPLERIKRFVGGALEAGAAGLCIADTVGVLTPFTAYQLTRELVAMLGGVPLFVHFHDDLGMATANSIMSCVAGARYVIGTFAGLGERAGNTCHEEVALALRVRYGVDVGVDLVKLTALARHVAQIARFPIPCNKPILGENAFSHETGIHVHGLLREPSTYEPFPPELIGREHVVRYGKHSGTSSMEYLAAAAGIEADPPAMQVALEEIKARACEGRPPSPAEAEEILREAAADPGPGSGRYGRPDRRPAEGGPSRDAWRRQ